MVVSDYDKTKTADDNVNDSTSVSNTAFKIEIQGGSTDSTGTGVCQIDTSNTTVDGKEDLEIFDSNDNTLDYHWEKFDTTNDVYVAIVEKGTYNKDGSTEIKIGYGNGSTDNSTTLANVFDPTPWTSVYILDEGSGTINDATSNNTDSTSETVTNYQVSGDSGYAIELDGVDDIVKFGTTAHGMASNNVGTFITLVNPNWNTNEIDHVIGSEEQTGGNAYFIAQNNGKMQAVFRINGNFNAAEQGTIPTSGNWHLLGWRYDGGTLEYLENNSVGASKNLTANINTPTNDWTIGGTDTQFTRLTDGDFDEHRVSDQVIADKRIDVIYRQSNAAGWMLLSWNASSSKAQQISAQTSTAQTSNPEPTVQATGAAKVTPQESTATTSNPEPAVNATGTATITAQESTASTSNPEATVSGTDTATLNAATSTVSASNPEPNVTLSGLINAPVSTASTSNPEPDISGTGNTTLQAETSTAQATIQEPTISGSGEATISVQANTANATTPEPNIAGTGSTTIQAENSTVSASNPEPSISIALQPRDASFTTSIKTESDETVSGDIDK